MARLGQRAHQVGFNPRPALLPGESVNRPDPKPDKGCFNPRPALLPGESRPSDCWASPVMWFQSTPGIAAGRIRLSRSALKLVKAVSIHARHCCRANRCFQQQVVRFCLFQSTPGIAAGRIVQKCRPNRRGYSVSIHARHCCRANRPSKGEILIFKRFQSTPGIAAGRIDAKS